MHTCIIIAINRIKTIDKLFLITIRREINYFVLKPYHPQRIMDVATGTGDFAIQACQMLQPAELDRKSVV